MICAPTAPAVPMAAVDAAPKPALNIISRSSREKRCELYTSDIYYHLVWMWISVNKSHLQLRHSEPRQMQNLPPRFLQNRSNEYFYSKFTKVLHRFFQIYKSVTQICKRLCSFSKQSVFLSKGQRNKKNVKQPIVAWNAAASEPAATPAEVNPEKKTQMFKVTIIVTCCSMDNNCNLLE